MKTPLPFVCILLVFLISCTPHTNAQVNVQIGDGGLLSDASCGPPCFWDITPGITGKSQAWDILAKRGVSQACQEESGGSEGIRSIQCRFGDSNTNRGIGMQFDHSNIIDFIIFDPTSPIAIQDVVKKYGAPSHIGVYQGGSAVLFYDAILTSLFLVRQGGSTYQLQADSKIEQVAYFTPQSYAADLQAMCCQLHEWHGYGVYPEK